MSFCFLVIKGFSLSKGFILKELALISSTGLTNQNWMFAPPYPIHHLSYVDRLAVEKIYTSLYDGLVTWNTGSARYASIETVFLEISRFYQNWIVLDEVTKTRIFGFKPLSVSLQLIQEILPSNFDFFLEHKGKARCKFDIVLMVSAPAPNFSLSEHRFPSKELKCLYEHSNCALQVSAAMLTGYLKAWSLVCEGEMEVSSSSYEVFSEESDVDMSEN